jgi:aspartyl-tRNA(Asn)/glutamyl-tRNA(Gln) amidotransferase subunit C
VKVTKKDVEHVAKLARLGLTDGEKEKFTEQLSNILDYAEAINKLDTKDIQPTSHAIPMKNVMREDKCIPFADSASILANAPSGSDNMFIVPKILD